MKRTIFLIFLIILATSVMGVGTNFENAELIKPGSYSEQFSEENTALFYKLNIEPGEVGYFVLKENKNELVSDITYYLYSENYTLFDSGISPWNIKRFSWAPGLSEKGKTYFLKIKDKENNTNNFKKFFLNFSVYDMSDVKTGTDIGGEFDSALEVSEGILGGHLWGGGKFKESDNADMYFIHIPKNKDKKLTATITTKNDRINYPEGKIDIIFYDENHDEITRNEVSVYYPTGLDFLTYPNPIDLTKDLKPAPILSDELKIATPVIGEARNIFVKIIRYGDGIAYNLELDIEKVTEEEKYWAGLDELPYSNDEYSNSEFGIFNFFALIAKILSFLSLISFGLFLWAIIEILNSKNDNNWKWKWGLVSFFIPILGSGSYLIFGRKSRIKKNSDSKTNKTIENNNSESQEGKNTEQKEETTDTTDKKVLQVKQYIQTAKSKGMTENEIRKQLTDTGWPEELVRKVFE
ncbi:MAG: PLD nuclease N-terminal domain-containing protein [Nanoarchaeota archaeon]|nr:PLD nuclease N-terminal domain-containing protein [Nanoarchaeota archaeon]MBU1855264.1 PLD nuclease N-terminal domain-containing protein [Nanoarchaeota archaeon]